MLLYRRRLKAVLDSMLKDNPILQKVYKNEPLQYEELATLTSSILTANPGVDLSLLNEFYGRTADQLDQTIRELVGLDLLAVEKHFTQFLHEHPSLTAQQTRFVNLLKQFISDNGGLELENLVDVPFNSVSPEGIDGVFTPEDVGSLVALLKPFLRPEAN